MKNILSKKGAGFYLQVLTILCAVVGLIAYTVAGQDSYGFVPAVDVLLALGIVCGIVFCVKDFFRAGPILTMAFLGSAVGVFLLSRFMYYAHQFYGIASDPITGAMVVTTAAFIGMLVFGMISAFFAWDKEGE